MAVFKVQPFSLKLKKNKRENMTYLQALENRSLSKENLPKNVQNKMAELDSLNKYIEEASEISEVLLDADEKNKIEEGKKKAAELQSFLIKKIESFDQEAFDRRKASYDNMLKVKKEKAEKAKKIEVVENMLEEKLQEQLDSNELVSEECKIQYDADLVAENIVPDIDDVLDDSSIYSNHRYEAANKIQEPVEQEPVQEIVANEVVENNYEDSIEIEQQGLNTNKTEPEEFEVEEFNKAETVKAKSKTVSFAIIAVGAAILTFGVVNLFKKK